jgi:hypothetical protein
MLFCRLYPDLLRRRRSTWQKKRPFQAPGLKRSFLISEVC